MLRRNSWYLWVIMLLVVANVALAAVYVSRMPDQMVSCTAPGVLYVQEGEWLCRPAGFDV